MYTVVYQESEGKFSVVSAEASNICGVMLYPDDQKDAVDELAIELEKWVGDGTDIQVVKCLKCGTFFFLSKDEANWYYQKGFKPPKRCPNCRKNKGQVVQVVPPKETENIHYIRGENRMWKRVTMKEFREYASQFQRNGCDCARKCEDYGGWMCTATGGTCMFLAPDSSSCASQYGKGPLVMPLRKRKENEEADQEGSETETTVVSDACTETVAPGEAYLVLD
jgi:hypothetical protein